MVDADCVVVEALVRFGFFCRRNRGILVVGTGLDQGVACCRCCWQGAVFNDARADCRADRALE